MQPGSLLHCIIKCREKCGNLDEILAMKKEVEDAGLHLAGIESVNVSDAIKTGGAGRDHDIQAYIRDIRKSRKSRYPYGLLQLHAGI